MSGRSGRALATLRRCYTRATHSSQVADPCVVCSDGLRGTCGATQLQTAAYIRNETHTELGNCEHNAETDSQTDSEREREGADRQAQHALSHIQRGLTALFDRRKAAVANLPRPAPKTAAASGVAGPGYSCVLCQAAIPDGCAELMPSKLQASNHHKPQQTFTQSLQPTPAAVCWHAATCVAHGACCVAPARPRRLQIARKMKRFQIAFSSPSGRVVWSEKPPVPTGTWHCSRLPSLPAPGLAASLRRRVPSAPGGARLPPAISTAACDELPRSGGFELVKCTAQCTAPDIRTHLRVNPFPIAAC